MDGRKIFNKQFIIGLGLGIAIAGLAGYALARYDQLQFWNPPAKDVEAKASDFVNKTVLNGQGTAVIKLAGRENGLYKLEVELNGQKFDSFMTADGKKFFPQVMDMNIKGTDQAKDGPVAAEVVKKSDKPSVELFVMSHCPYGTQIEKGIIPALEKLGDKIDFQLKFVDYAMHGEKELQEQLRQYCVQKEQKEKLLPYLNCFLKEGKSEECLAEAKIETGKLTACVSKTDAEFKVIADFKDKKNYQGNNPGFGVFKGDNEKYGIQGSPTLVINGEKNESGRDSASLLKAICSGFNQAPDECNAALSSDAPAPGFGAGSGSGAGGAGGGCGAK